MYRTIIPIAGIFYSCLKYTVSKKEKTAVQCRIHYILFTTIYIHTFFSNFQYYDGRFRAWYSFLVLIAKTIIQRKFKYDVHKLVADEKKHISPKTTNQGYDGKYGKVIV